ncbi:tetraketide alpha-pyrone reductase 2 [Tripterygium wilfordii]|uniref:Tetraketide alpha-pyrone reductase 2 n=1 Tax=Tripterygium wilfordii TaxID=458696 RepID=A0A7J7E0T8_TRIWF|nr:tetraketide alpha-pyrone reductase 2-like isoform X2 [Tripterygium wilfordii]KAF5751926.1 tetraketide alpha-pyrone reductase 2 [Tripterygium wilfordii]
MPEYCVTGGTGFIAAYLVKSLLENGHIVRATVRDPDDMGKVSFLWEFDGAKERLKIMKADLLIEGSFDEAVNGVDGVFHTASPVLVPHDNNENLIDPCINGTINVLNSCAKSKGVKRVVLTSSCSSIRYREDVRKLCPLNESHWSDLDYCKRNNLWYAYAKTAGEREAWKIAEEKGIDLVVVNPSFVVGPLLAPQPTSTILLILSIIKGVLGEYPNTRVGFVHIEDAISAHIIAMEESKASGRIICSSSVAHWSEILEMLKAKYPSYPYEDKCGSKIGDNNPHSLDTRKITELGFHQFKTLEQMFDDCIKSFQEKGFL